MYYAVDIFCCFPNCDGGIANFRGDVDKSTPVRGKVQTTVSYGKPEQDKARVRESRYVIKVMNDKTGGGEDPLN